MVTIHIVKAQAHIDLEAQAHIDLPEAQAHIDLEVPVQAHIGLEDLEVPAHIDLEDLEATVIHQGDPH